jgi:hypothetical protein
MQYFDGFLAHHILVDKSTISMVNHGGPIPNG